MVAVGADQVVGLQQRGGREDQGRCPGGVGGPGIDHADEVAGAQRAVHRRRFGEHRDGIARGDPYRPDRRVLQSQHFGSEEWLEDCARGRGDALDERVIECLSPLEVVGDAAARDAEVAGDGRQRVERAHDGAAVHPTCHAPADEDCRRSFVQAARDVLRRGGRDVRVLAPAGHRVREGEGAEFGDVVAVLLEAGLGPSALEQQPRNRHRQREVSTRARLQEGVAEPGGLVPDRIDQELRGA